MRKRLQTPVRAIGRYLLCREIASGGMASVHLGRMAAPARVSRPVAIKRLHAQYADDPAFVSMFLDEARIAARVRHPNVVSVHDIVAVEHELFLVMDYVLGESLSGMMRACSGAGVPLEIAAAIITDVLNGLHAAHETKSEDGTPMEVIHRDVSPQNILIGVDGIARLADFGIARAAGRLQTSHDGQLKGKIGYMAPERVLKGPIDRRLDVFSAAAVLWEMLVGRRLFEGETPAEVIHQILHVDPPVPSRENTQLSTRLDEVVRRGLARDPAQRYQSAKEMALAVEAAAALATTHQVAAWLDRHVSVVIERRRSWLSEVEQATLDAPQDDSISEAPVEERTLDEASQIDSTAPKSSSRFDRRRSYQRLAVGLASVASAGVLLSFWLVRLVMPAESDDQDKLNGLDKASTSSATMQVAIAAPESEKVSEKKRCGAAVVASGREPIIEDFEDGDSDIRNVEGRSGRWTAFGDYSGGKLTPSPFLPATGDAVSGGHSAKLRARGFRSWGSMLKFDFLTDGCAYDASIYDGIRFWAKGSGRMRVQVVIPQTTTVDYGGTCQDRCFDHFGVNFSLKQKWAEQRLVWNKLEQLGTGEPVRFSADALMGIELKSEEDYELHLDEIAFLTTGIEPERALLH